MWNRGWPTCSRRRPTDRCRWACVAYLAERGTHFSKIKPAGRGRECHPIPGSVLEREWDAHEYRVTVTADGRYELNGKRFNSLSATARHICGVSFSAVIEQINSATSI